MPDYNFSFHYSEIVVLQDALDDYKKTLIHEIEEHRNSMLPDDAFESRKREDFDTLLNLEQKLIIK